MGVQVAVRKKGLQTTKTRTGGTELDKDAIIWYYITFLLKNEKQIYREAKRQRRKEEGNPDIFFSIYGDVSLY